MEKQYDKTIGWLLVSGSLALFVPYSILAAIFDYPDVLRQDTATILTKFHAGGDALVWTWFAFAITGAPLIPAYMLLGRRMESISPLVRIATSMGVISLTLQMIGLLRWTFVVPVLAGNYVDTTDPGMKAATIVAFQSIHQFAGVILGEHLGQLFTIVWTILLTVVFTKSGFIPKWINRLGYASALIYLAAQAELFHTAMPDFPVWEPAGFIGSTLWLIWLTCIGICFLTYERCPGPAAAV